MTRKTSLSNGCRGTNELFGRVVGSGFNVGLDPFGDQFLVYADGYKLAADTVVQNLRGSKQVLVFPICYLYRHYLELMIKGLTRLAYAILNGKILYSDGHKLTELWEECRALLEKVMPQWPKTDFNNVGECIQAFASFDFDGEFPRYPEDRKRHPWPQPVDDINLQRMSKTVSAVADLLDCYYYEMDNRLKCAAEAASY